MDTRRQRESGAIRVPSVIGLTRDRPWDTNPAVTEPRRPDAGAASSPTPEEISERLEALLQRTHALRALQTARQAEGVVRPIVWPPPDGELEEFDMVHVPLSRPRDAVTPPSEALPGASAVATVAASPDDGRAQDDLSSLPDFGRPDWAELRLRDSQTDRPTAPRWMWLLLGAMGLTIVMQAAWLWQLQDPAAVSSRDGYLRVDGPAGAVVRVDGTEVGTAPIDHSLSPGDYRVEIALRDRQAQADSVTITAGRTVLLLPLAPPASGVSAAQAAPPAATPATRPASGSPVSAPAPTASTGTVVIESTPPGLAVTMEGRPRGVTPLTIGNLKPGRHDVLIGGMARRVSVSAGQISRLSISRQP